MIDPTREFGQAIGSRIRARRKVLSYNSQSFARMLGITQQQLNKYENGVDRISAVKLNEIARLLGVTPSYFFEDLAKIGMGNAILYSSKDYNPNKPAILEEKETRLLLKSFLSINDVRIRLAFVDLITSVAKRFQKSQVR